MSETRYFVRAFCSPANKACLSLLCTLSLAVSAQSKVPSPSLSQLHGTYSINYGYVQNYLTWGRNGCNGNQIEAAIVPANAQVTGTMTFDGDGNYTAKLTVSNVFDPAGSCKTIKSIATNGAVYSNKFDDHEAGQIPVWTYAGYAVYLAPQAAIFKGSYEVISSLESESWPEYNAVELTSCTTKTCKTCPECWDGFLNLPTIGIVQYNSKSVATTLTFTIGAAKQLPSTAKGYPPPDSYCASYLVSTCTTDGIMTLIEP